MITWTDVVSALSAAAAFITSALASSLALVAYVRSRRVEFEATRPFVIPRLELLRSGTETSLILCIKNVGDTPAQNVLIAFLPGTVWNWVKQPDYPFSSEEGISAIGPGEELRYFLGAIRDGNPLADIANRELKGSISFDNPRGGKRISDAFRASLADDRYKTK